MLTADRLSFQYTPTSPYVFSDVSMSLQQGTITALLGPSGAGKTTLLKCLALLEKPSGGTIRVDGRAYDFSSPTSLLDNPPWPELTVVFQQLFLWPHLTLRGNILLPLARRDKAKAQERLNALAETFRMHSFLDRYPNETSRGQQQRAALVRALMLEPKYILCDEITSALDVEQIANVLECLNQVKEQNVGIFIITHQLYFAQQTADQVIFMDQGRIIESGDRSCLSRPSTDRMTQFLKLVESVS